MCTPLFSHPLLLFSLIYRNIILCLLDFIANDKDTSTTIIYKFHSLAHNSFTEKLKLASFRASSYLRKCIDLLQLTTVVNVVDDSVATTGNALFYGLYNLSLPRRCWTKDSSRVLVSTPQICTVKSYVVDIESRTVTELEAGEGSQIVMDIDEDLVVCSRSSLKVPYSLVWGKLPAKGSECSIQWSAVTNWQPSTTFQALSFEHMHLSHDQADVKCKTFSAIYFGPTSEHNHEIPLIVWPHGGPHSAFTNDFKIEAALFALLGFGVLMVNYRGSIGAGQNTINFLCGRIGDSDVKDVKLATDVALKQFPFLNPNKIVLFGGSHGGFLVTHLSGQYPLFYKAVVARNPVIDVATMYSTSDIPDWSAVECGFSYQAKTEMSLEEFEKMKKSSPMNYASNVVAPTLLLIGKKDNRVPSIQGIHYHLHLKSNNIKTKLLQYEDCHPLSQVPVELDNLVNSALWFIEHTP